MKFKEHRNTPGFTSIAPHIFLDRCLNGNYEATYFEDSPQDALAFRKYVDNIPFQEKDILLPQTKGVFISKDFLLSPELGRKLLKAQAYKQFDLY